MAEQTFGIRVKNAWNAFFNNKDPTYDRGPSYYYRPDRARFTGGNERSIVSSIYNQIAIDVAAVSIKHVRVDQNGRYQETMDSKFNQALTLDANVDQTGRQMIQDLVESMCDEGVVAVVPYETTKDPRFTDSYDIYGLRVGQIIEWMPFDVKVRLYNEQTGRKEDKIFPKSMVAIVNNPLYAVMNEPNSTLKRLIRKMNLLDAIDEQSGSGKLDMIIQLPYVIKTDARREQAEKRRKEIEMQLAGSKYGIAYTDGTERITQLNRSVDNNLMSQIEYLTNLLYSQLGMTKSIFDGTADEATMLNYHNRTIEPILSAITDEFTRKFLSTTARTQGQVVKFFKDPFKLVPVSQVAEIADKFTRNEIMTSNEIRSVIGMMPSDDPGADELRNKNLNQTNNEVGEKNQNESTNDNK
jgi:hypothetical protein